MIEEGNESVMAHFLGLSENVETEVRMNAITQQSPLPRPKANLLLFSFLRSRATTKNALDSDVRNHQKLIRALTFTFVIREDENF